MVAVQNPTYLRKYAKLVDEVVILRKEKGKSGGILLFIWSKMFIFRRLAREAWRLISVTVQPSHRCAEAAEAGEGSGGKPHVSTKIRQTSR